MRNFTNKAGISGEQTVWSFTVATASGTLASGNSIMSPAATATAYSPDLVPEQECDMIAHFGSPDIWEAGGRFRFIPSSHLVGCDLESDSDVTHLRIYTGDLSSLGACDLDSYSGVAHLLYLRSLISDESEE